MLKYTKEFFITYSLFLFLLVGCHSAQDITYKTSKSAQITADGALKVWNDYLKDHTNVTVETEIKVKAAYDKYRKAQIALLNVAVASYNTNSVSTNSPSLDIAIATTSTALNELIELLSNLGIKL